MLADVALTFGDIVLVPFPFTNQTAAKKRPAVVISTAAYNTTRPDVIVMAVTSQLRPSAAFGDVWLTAWAAAGLLKPSAVKPVMATLEASLVIRRLGSLTEPDMQALLGGIAGIIGDAAAS